MNACRVCFAVRLRSLVLLRMRIVSFLISVAKLIFRWFQRVCSGGSAQLSAVFPVDNQAGLFCAAAAAADDKGMAAELAAGFALVTAGSFTGFVAGGGY